MRIAYTYNIPYHTEKELCILVKNNHKLVVVGSCSHGNHWIKNWQCLTVYFASWGKSTAGVNVL